MDRSLLPDEWKPGDSAGNRMASQSHLGLLSAVPPMRMLAAEFIAACSFSGCLSQCVLVDGRQDNEICRDLHISAGYMSKFLRSVGEAWFRRVVLFMRTTRCLAPLQKLADEMGCDLVMRSSVAAELAAARARVAQLEGRQA